MDFKSVFKNSYKRDFLGGPVLKTPSSQCRGPEFDPWSVNQIPRATTQSPRVATKTWHNQIINIKNSYEIYLTYVKLAKIKLYIPIMLEQRRKSTFVFGRWSYLVCTCLLIQCLTLCYPRLQPTRLFCPWDSPGKNIGVGCHALFQVIYLTQGTHIQMWQKT